MKKSISFLMFLLIISCGDNYKNNYPKGIKFKNFDSVSPCNVDACSDERVVRLTAKNVVGTIDYVEHLDTYALTYPASFDSYYRFFFCDLPNDMKEEGLEVKFSGDLVDACGIWDPYWPTEETYIVKLTKIEIK